MENNKSDLTYHLSDVDKGILDIIQSNFPLSARPYLDLANQLEISEEEAFYCVQNLKQLGIIRRLGANFQSDKLGFYTTLCAAKVNSDKLDSFIEEVNSCPGVTHNYLRDHDYNIWFTLIAKSKDAAIEILENFTKKTGVEILNLPAKRLYKIRVDFAMQDK